MGKDRKPHNGHSFLMHWFQPWSPQKLCCLKRHLNPSTCMERGYRKPQYLLCNVCPCSCHFFFPQTPLSTHLSLFPLNSVFFPQSTFLLSALMSSPSSCDVCRHNPALKKSLCSFCVFCYVYRKPQNPFTDKYSPLCCLPPSLPPFRSLPKLALASWLSPGQVQ